MRVHFRRGEWAKAEEGARRLLEEDPQSSSAMVYLALCQFNQKQRDQAAITLGDARKLAPDSFLVHHACVEIALLTMDTATAQSSLAVLHRQQPDSAEVALLQAGFEGLVGHQERQAAWLQEARRRDPDDQDVQVAAVKYLLQHGQRRQAGEELQAMLTRWPEEAEIHCLAGEQALHSGNSRQAQQHYRDALRLDPQREKAREGLMEALRSRNLGYGWSHRLLPWLRRRGEEPLFLVLLGLAFLALMILRPQSFIYVVAVVLVLAGVLLLSQRISDALLFLRREHRQVMTPRQIHVTVGIAWILLGNLSLLILTWALALPWRAWAGEVGYVSFLLLMLVLAGRLPHHRPILVLATLLGLWSLFWRLPQAALWGGFHAGAGLWAFLPTAILMVCNAWALWHLEWPRRRP